VIGPYCFPAPKALNANVVGLDCSAVTVFPACLLLLRPLVVPARPPSCSTKRDDAVSQPKPPAIPGTTQGFTLQQ
jgi:hypothetical protein